MGADQFPAAVELVPIDSVLLDPENARVHDARNLEAIKRSLQEFGQRTPIVVDGRGVILKGNGTLQAAKELGWSQIAITRTALTGVDAAAYSLIDNRSSDMSKFDFARVASLLQTLPADKVIGWNDKEISEVMASLAQRDGLTAPDDTPDAPAVPVTQAGDMWICGDHKILCGDSRIKEHTDKLFEDGLPFMMVTDPPYGVNYDPEWRHRCGLNNSDRIGSVTNDGIADWTDVWRAFPGRVAYVWHGGLHSGTVQKSLEDAGFAVRSQILWVKPKLVISRGHYHWKHEPAFEAERAGQPAVPSPDQPSELIAETELACESEAWYAARKGESTKWVGGRKQTTVWEVDYKGDVKTHHGTQKPVECMARAIRNHGSPGSIVFEPFLGSGTTVIACEQTGRKCVACEIDPAYVDVAVDRWEKFTGKKAVLVSGAVSVPSVAVPGESLEDRPEESLSDVIDVATISEEVQCLPTVK